MTHPALFLFKIWCDRPRTMSRLLGLICLGLTYNGLATPSQADVVIPEPEIAPVVAPQAPAPTGQMELQRSNPAPSLGQPHAFPSPAEVPTLERPGSLSTPAPLPIPQEPTPAIPVHRSPEVAQPAHPQLPADLPSADSTTSTSTIVYVNPTAPMAQDRVGSGNEQLPYRTITYALQQAKPGTVVQLAPGLYSQQTGETFPLFVPAGTTLRGDTAQPQTVQIMGGAVLVSRTFASQNMAILVGNQTIVEGITVTNPNVRGTGIWVESTNPQIRHCLFTKNHREGIFVTGTANPKIEANTFVENGGNGISVASEATGEITANVFDKTGFGLAIGQKSAPLINGNRIMHNVDGIYVNDAARPILRNNVIEANQRTGIVATIRAQPNLGTINSPGNNTIRANGKFDLLNGTKQETIYSIGNVLDPKRVFGRVEFEMSPSAALPKVLMP